MIPCPHLRCVVHDPGRLPRAVVVLGTLLGPRRERLDGGVTLHAVLLCEAARLSGVYSSQLRVCAGRVCVAIVERIKAKMLRKRGYN